MSRVIEYKGVKIKIPKGAKIDDDKILGCIRRAFAKPKVKAAKVKAKTKEKAKDDYWIAPTGTRVDSRNPHLKQYFDTIAEQQGIPVAKPAAVNVTVTPAAAPKKKRERLRGRRRRRRSRRSGKRRHQPRAV